MPLGNDIDLSPGDIVLDGDQAPPKGHSPPTFQPMSIVAKQLNGSRCHLVQRYALAQATLCQMGTQLPLQNSPRRAQPCPNFRPMSVVAQSWMDQDATWYGARPRPRQHCVRWGPSSPPPTKKGHIFIVAKGSPVSATAERLFVFILCCM